MIMYSLTYDCLDYYCDGMHLIGIFDTEDKAHEIRDLLFSGKRPDNFHKDYLWSSYAYTIVPITINKVYDGL